MVVIKQGLSSIVRIYRNIILKNGRPMVALAVFLQIIILFKFSRMRDLCHFAAFRTLGSDEIL